MKHRINFHRFVAVVLASSMGVFPACAAGQNGLTGDWARDDGSTRIKIAQCGANYCATNIWVKNPKGKEHVGDELILAVKPVSSDVLQGQAYDVRRQMKYKITINVGSAALHTSGCVLFGIICKSADWTKQG